MSTRKGPPKHANKVGWKANAGVKKNDKELGGKLHPYPAVRGVCPRCRAQIEWRRKYGKYKALTEPAKCNQCSKRAVRHAYHALCSGCASERNVCAKCCQPSEVIVGKHAEEKEEQQQVLEHALKNLRERDKRTLLRAMNQGKRHELGNSLDATGSRTKNSNDNEEKCGFGDEGEDSDSESEDSDLSEDLDEATDLENEKSQEGLKVVEMQSMSLKG